MCLQRPLGRAAPQNDVTCTLSSLFHHGLVRPWCLTWPIMSAEGPFCYKTEKRSSGCYFSRIFLLLVCHLNFFSPSVIPAITWLFMVWGWKRANQMASSFFYWCTHFLDTRVFLESFPMVPSFKITSIFYKVGVVSGLPNISWFFQYGAWTIMSQRTLPSLCWAGVPNAVS